MKGSVAGFIVGALDKAGEEAELHEEYSGRGMYGKTTYGVVTSANVGKILAACVLYYDEFCDHELEEGLDDLLSEGVQQDSMGHDVIYY